MRQVAALPYRIDESGRVQVLLVTSRTTRRWILPKGHIEPGMRPEQAAAAEALEEGGVAGTISSKRIGSYSDEKVLPDGSRIRVTIDVFPLIVGREYEKWLEQDQRKRIWVEIEQASELVVNPELSGFLRDAAGDLSA